MKAIRIRWGLAIRLTMAGGLTMAGLMASPVRAGNLQPPGPPAPTMKTLVQVEPRLSVQGLAGSGSALFVISQPGSYYLTSNIVAVAPGKHGIEIASDSVTLDLMGFAITGPGSGSDSGIFVTAPTAAIHNGAIRSWGGNGITAPVASSVLARDLRLGSNGASGMIAGNASVVVGCVAEANGNDGILVGTASRISGCSAFGNGGSGIGAGVGSSISDCATMGNVADGISVGDGSTVTSCVAVANGGDGIRAGGTLVLGNSASQNLGAGIRVSGRGSRIDGNTVFRNSRGIDANDSATVEGNVIIRNTAMCNPGVGATNATNYEVDANDDLGPTGSAATSTSPWANITVYGAGACS